MKVTHLCPTLFNPMDDTDNGILQTGILEWVGFPFSRGSSQPRDRTQVSCIAGGFFFFFFNFILLYNTVLVLPCIDMNPPRVYMSYGEGNGNPLQ